MIELDRFLDRMSLAARQVGVVALQFHGKVANRGKEVGAGYENALHRAAAEALSDVDLAAQEILLLALAEHYPFVRVEPEEETPLVARFAGNDSPYTVVLDPIDGTLNYISLGGQFAVAVGLLEHERFVASLVYFPLRGELHRAVRDAGSRVERVAAAPQGTVPLSRDVVFHDTATPAEAIAAIERLGLTCTRSGCSMVDSTVAATALGVASFCARRPSIRRAIGALVSREAGGHLCDAEGAPYDCTRPDDLDSLVVARDRATADRLLSAIGRRP